MMGISLAVILVPCGVMTNLRVLMYWNSSAGVDGWELGLDGMGVSYLEDLATPVLRRSPEHAGGHYPNRILTIF
jgi:hypothetical protein